MLRQWRLAMGLLFLVIFLSEVSAFGEIKTSWGGNERVRYELWVNNFDLQTKDGTNESKDNRSYFRFKTNLWGKVDFNKDLSTYVRLANEFRIWSYWFQSTSKKKGYHGDMLEFFVDNFYVDINNIAGQPLNIRFGRQDLGGLYGESFLIGDGTPGDGSRSAYFNAIKTSYKVDDKNSVDFIYTRNPRDDTFLPVLNEDKQPQNLSTTDEQAFMLVWKNNKGLLKNVYLEPYYIWKFEDDDYGSGAQLYKGHINTWGAFVKWMSDPWTIRGQLALQGGNYGEHDRRALGGYVYLDRAFKNQYLPVATVGYMYLSGDKPGTSQNEGFNPLFSRYPMLGDLYGWTIGRTGDQGTYYYWSNLSMFRAQLAFKPCSRSKLTTNYNLLMAPQLVSVANRGAGFFGDGHIRGHLFTSKFEYMFKKNLNGFVQLEYLLPGSFYESDQDDAYFLRTELTYKF